MSRCGALSRICSDNCPSMYVSGLVAFAPTVPRLSRSPNGSSELCKCKCSFYASFVSDNYRRLKNERSGQRVKLKQSKDTVG